MTQVAITFGVIIGTLVLMIVLTSPHKERNYPTAEERWADETPSDDRERNERTERTD
jgi:hypothetical protein